MQCSLWSIIVSKECMRACNQFFFPCQAVHSMGNCATPFANKCVNLTLISVFPTVTLTALNSHFSDIQSNLNSRGPIKNKHMNKKTPTNKQTNERITSGHGKTFFGGTFEDIFPSFAPLLFQHHVVLEQPPQWRLNYSLEIAALLHRPAVESPTTFSSVYVSILPSASHLSLSPECL